MDKIKELEKQIAALKAELKEAKQNRAKETHFSYLELKNNGDVSVSATCRFTLRLKDIASGVGTAKWWPDGSKILLDAGTPLKEMNEAQIRIGNEFIQDIIPIIRAYSLKAANINGKK